MRVAIGTYKPATEDFLRFAVRLGVDDVLLTPHRHEGFDSAATRPPHNVISSCNFYYRIFSLMVLSTGSTSILAADTSPHSCRAID